MLSWSCDEIMETLAEAELEAFDYLVAVKVGVDSEAESVSGRRCYEPKVTYAVGKLSNPGFLDAEQLGTCGLY